MNSQNLELLYRGSLHGFKSSIFNPICDNVPKTLTIVKTTDGDLFVRFMEFKRNSFSFAELKVDENSVRFYLRNGENTPVKLMPGSTTLRVDKCCGFSKCLGFFWFSFWFKIQEIEVFQLRNN